MKGLAELREAEVAQKLAREISLLPSERPLRFMEVCGGHTAVIYRFALPDLLPENIKLLSGPGCPVCVTANDFIDRAIALAKLPDVTIATFGDLIRVPGSTKSLADARSEGADIRVFYSSAEALESARRDSHRRIIFMGIGFETTACTLAATLNEAVETKTDNFFLLSAAKTMPEALRSLVSAGDSTVDGLILPGHVIAVTGTQCFEFLAGEYGVPCVVSGFEPADLMESVLMLCKQIRANRARIENQYKRVVRPEGNTGAQAVITKMFEPCDVNWRGFGAIPNSGLKMREKYAKWDAASIEVEVEVTHEHAGCRCGEVLRGKISPMQCGLYGKTCTPDSPKGACMVSSEGACAAVYHFSAVSNG